VHPVEQPHHVPLELPAVLTAVGFYKTQPLPILSQWAHELVLPLRAGLLELLGLVILDFQFAMF
jgi:hypothetical protein